MRNLDETIRLGASDEVADLVWTVGEYMAILRGPGSSVQQLNAAARRIERAWDGLQAAHQANERALDDYKNDNTPIHLPKRRADGLGE